MLRFSESAVAAASPREVWKILHDPSRFPDWWAGLASIEDVGAVGDAETRFTAYLDRAVYEDMDPRRPMGYTLRSHGDGERVVVSCLVADIEFDWRLEPVNGGRETRIDVAVAVPERRANRFELMRRIIDDSIPRLVRLAEEAAA
ncbi:MAG: hypothetical protein QOK40_1756 [Miltoncostaeaceae bacterium]|jgi:uncharacterized protein YndB with AHSA1/START domain|nr:hypothetical protein [Miltoncostaeaceae bacterium]